MSTPESESFVEIRKFSFCFKQLKLENIENQSPSIIAGSIVVSTMKTRVTTLSIQVIIQVTIVRIA